MRSSALDVNAIRKHFLFPGTGRIVTNNAASTQPPRELLALYRALSPTYENVHRGQSSASQHMTRRFEESYDNIARFLSARPQQHRRRSEHDRGPQRRDVLAADAVSGRGQRRHHDDGAQLELRSVVRDVQGDPAEVRAAGGVSAGALPSADRRARSGSHGVLDRRPNQACVLRRGIQFLRHEEPARRYP